MIAGCPSTHQQERLLRINSIGGVEISTKIPLPKVEGVVRNIPIEVSTEDILAIIDPSAHPVAVQRLTYINGQPSHAVRVTFTTTILPNTVVINKTRHTVNPFVQSVTRCYRCQKLGHSTKESCKAKAPRCPTSGLPGHRASECSNDRRCINCNGPHFAAYRGCPALKLLSEANTIRAQCYMPKAQAIQQAKAMLQQQKGPSTLHAEDVPAAPPDGWTKELPVKPATKAQQYTPTTASPP